MLIRVSCGSCGGGGNFIVSELWKVTYGEVGGRRAKGGKRNHAIP